MKKSMVILLALAVVVAMAMPAMAIEGQVTSRVELDDDGLDVFTFLVGELNFISMAPDYTTMNLYFEFNDNDQLFVGPDVQYTGIDNLTLGLIGSLDDEEYDYMVNLDNTDEYGLELYANYSTDEIISDWTLGADNTFDITHGDNPLETELFANYEMILDETMTAGLKNSLEIGIVDSDDLELTINPFLNIDMMLAEDISFTSANDFELSKDLDDSDSDLETVITIAPELKYTAIPDFALGVKGAMDGDDYDDDEMLVTDFEDTAIAMDFYANYAKAVNPELTVGVDNSVILVKDDPGVLSGDNANRLSIKPHVEYGMPLTPELSLAAEASYELGTVLADIDFDGEFEAELGVTYRF